ncbi:MAG: hypothetical protein K2P58_05160 [Hyphomonadaceae bacterium]|nr:hypothetical protein [Hyphomonadaceae bacterium]
MKRIAATVAALVALAGCYELPGPPGQLIADCTPISAADYEAARESRSAWNSIDLRGGGFSGEGAGHTQKRCWQRVVGLNSPDRRCVQTNDLVVEMRTDSATTYYRVPARTNYALYGEGGIAHCRIEASETQ